MKIGWLISIFLISTSALLYYTFNWVHYRTPVVTPIVDENNISDYEASQLGKEVIKDRTYYWKTTYTKTVVTNGFWFKVTRDTTSRQLWWKTCNCNN
jgi:hypothetical protein